MSAAPDLRMTMSNTYQHADGSECLWDIHDQAWYPMHPLYPMLRACHQSHEPQPDLGQRLAEMEAENRRLRGQVARVEALGKQWERLARNASKTYSEIRRRHAGELRAALSDDLPTQHQPGGDQ